ncbi:DUF3037 domain-containing protein [Methylobacterium sp. J-078]|uniref:DUF3037 domain-containing protein n=1 Tax=Methylobacterium sp. J-078 TaxID=2836657 RepID=UPI001FB8DF3B|nr:DUF3037 domain-containing protein [Methylobacterium sp. J-078]MCJ2044416.1 DUF3037 domain-containing protein [Methylobacterium sp. J-078]
MMARSYEFAIIRFAPDDGRDERLNVGAVVFQDDGLDIRVSRRLEKIRALSAALDVDLLREFIVGLSDIDQRMRDSGSFDIGCRKQIMSSLGPIKLSQVGQFWVEQQSDYEDRISSILKSYVDPEPALPRAKRKSSKLLTQIKSEFRKERVLAQRHEDIESHRIVSGFELDEGLVADLVLRNGAMHVVETVDASNDEVSLRRAIGDIAVSALVLERARMRFGDKKTKARLVYNASANIERIARPSLDAAEHQGAELINWSSATQRSHFVHELANLATPVAKKNKRGQVRFSPGREHGFNF